MDIQCCVRFIFWDANPRLLLFSPKIPLLDVHVRAWPLTETALTMAVFLRSFRPCFRSASNNSSGDSSSCLHNSFEGSAQYHVGPDDMEGRGERSVFLCFCYYWWDHSLPTMNLPALTVTAVSWDLNIEDINLFFQGARSALTSTPEDGISDIVYNFWKTSSRLFISSETKRRRWECAVISIYDRIQYIS